MADITVGNKTLATPAQYAGSVTFAHNNNGDTLFVGGGNQDPYKHTSCTYNGVAMTELWDQFDAVLATPL